MKVFLQAFLHLVYTSDKKTEFFKDKTVKKYDLITYGYHWNKEKGELTFRLVLDLNLGNLPEKSFVLSHQIHEIPQKPGGWTAWCHGQHPQLLGNSCLVQNISECKSSQIRIITTGWELPKWSQPHLCITDLGKLYWIQQGGMRPAGIAVPAAGSCLLQPKQGEAAGLGFPPGGIQLKQVKKNMAQGPSCETVFKITNSE